MAASNIFGQVLGGPFGKRGIASAFPSNVYEPGRIEPFELPRDAVIFGDSLSADAYATPFEVWKVVNSLLLGAHILYCEGIGGQDSDQIVDRMENVDTTIVTPGLTRAQQMACDVIVAMGRNADRSSTIGSTGRVAFTMANFARAYAAITSGKFLFVPPPNANIEPYGDPAMLQCRAVMRKLVALYPNNTTGYRELLMDEGSNGTVADRTGIAAGYPPRSVRIVASGAEDFLHFGRKGSEIRGRRLYLPWLHARAGLSAFPMLYQERLIYGPAATAARVLGGTVTTIGLEGVPDSCTIYGGTNVGDYAISNSGVITNRTGTDFSGRPFDDLYIAVTKNGVERRCRLRLYIALEGTACTGTDFDNTFWLGQPDAPAAGSIDVTKWSFYITLRRMAGYDGRVAYILSSEKFGRASIWFTAQNMLRVVLKRDESNPADPHYANYPGSDVGITVAFLQSSVPIQAADGIVTIAGHVDLTAGTAQLRINGTDRLGTTIITSGATANLSYRRIVGGLRQTGQDGSGGPDNPAMCTIYQFGMFADKIDWSVHESEVYDSVTKLPVALPADGKVAGLDPTDWIYGNDAQKWWGVNGGSSGDYVGNDPPQVNRPPNNFINPAPVDGTWTPYDLGAKLVGWLNADDFGTANVTDVGGRVSQWKCRISGIAFTDGGVSARRPLYVPTEVNGLKAAIVSDDGARFLENTTFSSYWPVGSTPGEIWDATTGPGSADANSRFSVAMGGTGGGTQRRLTKNASDLATISDGTISSSGGAGLPKLTDFAIVGGRFETSQLTINVNGRQGTPTALGGLATGTTRARLFGSTANTAANLWKRGLRHVFVIAGILTDSERDKLASWIAWDCEKPDVLEDTHPYRLARP